MKRIVFDGYLKTMYPDGIEVEGDSPFECLSALAQFPGFRLSDNVRHEVVLPHFLSRDAIMARTDADEIRVVPMLMGAGGRGFGQILLGALLVAAAFVTGNPMLLKVGIGLIAGGIVQALMPAPRTSVSGSQEEKSSYLPAGKNTVQTGTRIPLLLGRRKHFGHILSLNVTAVDKQPSATATAPSGGSAYVVDSNYGMTEYTGGGA